MDNGTIRVLDLLFVMKDEDGVVTTLAIEDLDQEAPLSRRSTSPSPVRSTRRMPTRSARTLPANSSALLVAFENVWARKVVSALPAADAVLIDSIRIPAEVVRASTGPVKVHHRREETKWD